MKLKVCGMKYPDNILALAKVKPDYIGFIFYESSPRNNSLETLPKLPSTIQRVGVFVDANLQEILHKITQFDLHLVQLHGSESPAFCKALKAATKNIAIIKAFSIKDSFPFTDIEPYEEVVDYFLFDTKGAHPGGNGYTFNWNVLEQYPSRKPYFLSGGIALEQVHALAQFKQSKAATYCHAIDINSQFETDAGQKDIARIALFQEQMINLF